MRILCVISDVDSCFQFRIRQPLNELKKFGVTYDIYAFMPSEIGEDQTQYLLGFVDQYDLVIIQRLYLLAWIQTFATLCEYLGKPLIYETDDDYQNIIPSNPAYLSIVSNQKLFKEFIDAREKGNEEKAKEILPQLVALRDAGIKEYQKGLTLVDHVTTSTKELADTIYPFNKNVTVFENNVERVFERRDNCNLAQCVTETDQPGEFNIEVPNMLDMWTIPNFAHFKAELPLNKIPRIGYTGTPSHWGEDWDTICKPLNDFHNENVKACNHFLVMIGVGNFYQSIEQKQGVFYIKPTSSYEKYIFNLRNIDIGLCPVYPTIFNQSKSDLKSLEFSSWRGTVPLVPNFITYTRHFKNEENCLVYMNQNEFKEQLERLVKDEPLRKRLGENAFTYVRDNRQEFQHAERRYNFYESVIKEKS